MNIINLVNEVLGPLDERDCHAVSHMRFRGIAFPFLRGGITWISMAKCGEKDCACYDTTMPTRDSSVIIRSYLRFRMWLSSLSSKYILGCLLDTKHAKLLYYAASLTLALEPSFESKKKQGLAWGES